MLPWLVKGERKPKNWICWLNFWGKPCVLDPGSLSAMQLEAIRFPGRGNGPASEPPQIAFQRFVVSSITAVQCGYLRQRPNWNPFVPSRSGGATSTSVRHDVRARAEGRRQPRRSVPSTYSILARGVLGLGDELGSLSHRGIAETVLSTQITTVVY
ncbi:hypothetical protein BDV12DRAFT_41515 [Aspergillus spectabilis]